MNLRERYPAAFETIINAALVAARDRQMIIPRNSPLFARLKLVVDRQPTYFLPQLLPFDFKVAGHEAVCAMRVEIRADRPPCHGLTIFVEPTPDGKRMVGDWHSYYDAVEAGLCKAFAQATGEFSHGDPLPDGGWLEGSARFLKELTQ